MSRAPKAGAVALHFNAALAGEALDAIVMDALGIGQPAGEDGGGPGILTQLSRTVGSMQKFMKQLSN